MTSKAAEDSVFNADSAPSSDSEATPETSNVKTSRKRLNDMNGKDWVKSTKSVWMDSNDREFMRTVEDAMKSGSMFSESPPRDQWKKKHPATFSENDVGKLIRFFTQSGETVLDPFLGSGSSAIASINEGRHFFGIELYSEWFDIAKQRINQLDNQQNVSCDIRMGDSLEVMRGLEAESFDFIVTSPPYWGILGKKDHKAKNERIDKGLATDYGNHPLDLSHVESYSQFLETLSEHFSEYYRILNRSKYAAIIVSDFRHGKEYYMFHSDIASLMRRNGLVIQGLIVLIQDNKKLYPYGYPSTYVPNISNQFIVIGRKL